MSHFSLKKLYLYGVSFGSLVVGAIALVLVINLVLNTFVFKKAEDSYNYTNYDMRPVYCQEQEESKKANKDMYVDPLCDDKYRAEQKELEQKRKEAGKQHTLSIAISLFAVALPLFITHWRLARKE